MAEEAAVENKDKVEEKPATEVAEPTSTPPTPEAPNTKPETPKAPEPASTPTVAPPVSSTTTPPKRRSGVLIAAIVVVVIAILAAAAYAAYNYFYVSTPNNPTATPSPTASVSATTSASPSSSASAQTNLDPGVVWVKPAKLADLNLFKLQVQGTESQTSDVTETHYYKIGTNAANEDIILAEVQFEGPSLGLTQYRFIKSKTGQYRLIIKNSADIGGLPAADLGVFDKDNATRLLSLDPDTAIISGTTKLVRGSFMNITPQTDGTMLFSPTDEKVVTSTKWGSLYRGYLTVTSLTGPVKVGTYYLKLADTTKVPYQPKPTFINDDGTFKGVTWTNTVGSTVKFAMMRTSGCGVGTSGFPALTDLTADGTQKVALDSSVNKYQLFSPADKSAALVTYAYDLYSGSASGTAKTVDEYYQNLGVITWIDAFGDHVVYINTDLAPQAECGKPVIYLYPERDTQVSVKVGATITKSEPAYGNGWSVMAHKGGMLTVGAKDYDSLFWEGLGLGFYPAITTGTVVTKADVVPTIKSQMATMGFNDKEVNDFLDFWAPKLPTTPYTRLSWLQTKEMNSLAPLSVVPRPQSTLRAFLDFSGLSSKAAIPTQTLNHVDRNGFTLVEWGGLLIK